MPAPSPDGFRGAPGVRPATRKDEKVDYERINASLLACRPILRLLPAMITALLFAGAGLASTGVIAVDGSDPARQPPVESSTDRVRAPRPSYPPFTYYLVESQEQYDAVVAWRADQARAAPGHNDGWFDVLIAGTPASNAEAWEEVEQAKSILWQCCPTARLHVVDLRGR
jgi:hypothetical protein